MNKQVIMDAIKVLEAEEPTVENVHELATLYIVRDNLADNVDNSVDKVDVIESYRDYCDAKRKYQMHEGTEESVLDGMHLVCDEIKDLIMLLYSNSDMRRERKMIQNMIIKLYEIFSK